MYTGSRNGSVKAFDKRLDGRQKPQDLFGEKFQADTRSITHLSVVQEWQMLVSTIRGDVRVLAPCVALCPILTKPIPVGAA